MEKLKLQIELKVHELESVYDDYLERIEDIYYQGSYSVLEQRLHDLRIEINTYKRILDLMED